MQWSFLTKQKQALRQFIRKKRFGKYQYPFPCLAKCDLCQNGHYGKGPEDFAQKMGKVQWLFFCVTLRGYSLYYNTEIIYNLDGSSQFFIKSLEENPFLPV